MRFESDALPSPQFRRAKRQDVSEGDHEAFGKRTLRRSAVRRRPPPLPLSSPFTHTHGRRDRFVSQAVGSASLARARNCEEPRSRERAGYPYFRAMQPAQARSRGQIKKPGSTEPCCLDAASTVTISPVTLSCLSLCRVCVLSALGGVPLSSYWGSGASDGC